jgi:hypothetical protein
VIYLQHRLQRASSLRSIGVLPTVHEPLRSELCAELRAAFPAATVHVTPGGGRAGGFDLLVVPFTRSLHRRFVSEKTRLVTRALRTPTPAVMLYDVAHRRTDVLPRWRLPSWYVRGVIESLIVLLGRAVGWRRS